MAAVDAAAPPCPAALRDQIGHLSLPTRTAALLGDTPEDGSPWPHPRSSRARVARSPEASAVAELCAALHTLVGHLACGATDVASYRNALARLVGLGPGLTPTGDDLIVAIVAASRVLSLGDAVGGEPLIARAAAEALATAVFALPPTSTTDVAHHLLYESAAGRVPVPLASLVGVLGDPRADRDTVTLLVARLVTTGSHSGADWLAGVVALCRAVLSRRAAAGV